MLTIRSFYTRAMLFLRKQPESFFWLCAVATAWQALGQGFATEIWFHWLWCILFSIAAIANFLQISAKSRDLLWVASSTTVTALLTRPVGLVLEIVEGHAGRSVNKTFIGIGLYLFLAAMASYVFHGLSVAASVDRLED